MGSPMQKQKTPGGVAGPGRKPNKTVAFLDMLVGYQLLMSYVLAHIWGGVFTTSRAKRGV